MRTITVDFAKLSKGRGFCLISCPACKKIMTISFTPEERRKIETCPNCGGEFITEKKNKSALDTILETAENEAPDWVDKLR